MNNFVKNLTDAQLRAVIYSIVGDPVTYESDTEAVGKVRELLAPTAPPGRLPLTDLVTDLVFGSEKKTLSPQELNPTYVGNIFTNKEMRFISAIIHTAEPLTLDASEVINRLHDRTGQIYRGTTAGPALSWFLKVNPKLRAKVKRAENPRKDLANSAKLQDEIRAEYRNGTTVHELSRRYQLSLGTIDLVLYRRAPYDRGVITR